MGEVPLTGSKTRAARPCGPCADETRGPAWRRAPRRASGAGTGVLSSALRSLLPLAFAAAAAGCSAGGPPSTAAGPPSRPAAPVLVRQSPGTDALLQAVSAVDDTTVWVSGQQGTWARSTDGGATWTVGRVPGADTLQFRDVHAASVRTAWLLSAGPGELSRVYRTDDGGGSWRRLWTNAEADGFYDCFDFMDREHALLFGDAVGGELRVLETDDGGTTWRRVPPSLLPRALPGEGGFAASGTCVSGHRDGEAWIATGNGPEPRILHRTGAGRPWTATPLPLAAGEGAGAFSVAFRNRTRGVAVGGSLARPDTRGDSTVAITPDGGKTWYRGGTLPFSGPAFGVAWVSGAPGAWLVTVGPGGAAWSANGGLSWSPLDLHPYWGVDFASPRSGWLAGPGGRVTRVVFP